MSVNSIVVYKINLITVTLKAVDSVLENSIKSYLILRYSILKVKKKLQYKIIVKFQ